MERDSKMVNYMENAMNRNGRRVMIVVIIVFIVIILFLKMKYGTYGGYDFNRFFNQTKQEVLQKNGKPKSRDVLDETCEDINFDGIEYTFGAKYPYSARITDPNIRFGILKIGVGSPRWEVMLAYGLKAPLENDEKNQYNVQNGIYATTFYFDENNCVYKIACEVGVYTF